MGEGRILYTLSLQRPVKGAGLNKAIYNLYLGTIYRTPIASTHTGESII